MLKRFVKQIDWLIFKVQIWRKLRLQLKAANERMTFHQEGKEKDHGKKVLLENVEIAAKELKRKHFSLSSINK